MNSPNKELSSPPQPPIEGNRRPIILTIVCILNIAGAILNLVRGFFVSPSKHGEWYLPLLAISGMVAIVAMVGVWRMRRWGVYTYIGLCFLAQIALIAMLGYFNWTALLLRCAVVAILLVYFRRMR